MTSSTQNNHKIDKAPEATPKSTIKSVDSYEGKTKNTLCSEHAATSKTAFEAEPTNSLKSSLSANNFDSKLKNGIRMGEKNTKKYTEKEDIQSQPTSKLEGKLNLYGNSNLNIKTKDKNPIASCTTVSAVRSLNSPIHQKPASNSNKVDTDISSYSIPVDTPLPPALPFGGQNDSNGPVSINSPNVIQNDIELNDNHEKEPLFSNKNDCSDKPDISADCHTKQGPSTSAFAAQNSGKLIDSLTNITKNDIEDSTVLQRNLPTLEDDNASTVPQLDIIENDSESSKKWSP